MGEFTSPVQAIVLTDLFAYMCRVNNRDCDIRR